MLICALPIIGRTGGPTCRKKAGKAFFILVRRCRFENFGPFFGGARCAAGQGYAAEQRCAAKQGRPLLKIAKARCKM